MSNITFTVTAIFPEESIAAFATNRGWTPSEEGLAAAAFCEEFFKKVLIEQVSVDRINTLNIQLEETKQATIAQIGAAMAQAITITSEGE